MVASASSSRPNARPAAAAPGCASVAARMAPSTSARMSLGLDWFMRRDYTDRCGERQSRAAFRPERTAPSMVAGRPGLGPVAGQEQIAPAVLAPGRRRVLLRRGGEGGALFLDDLPGRQWRRQCPSALATSAQTARASSSRSLSTMASAPQTVTEMRSGKAKIHSAVPPITPSIGGAPGGRRNAGNAR